MIHPPKLHPQGPRSAVRLLLAVLLATGGVAGWSKTVSAEVDALEPPAAHDVVKSFVLIASPGDSFAVAISRQLSNSPEQAAAMASVLLEMDLSDQPVQFGTKLVSASQVDLARQAFELESSQPGSGVELAERIAPSENSLVQSHDLQSGTAAMDPPTVTPLGASPTFVGLQRIDAFTCVGTSCTLQASRTLETRIDLGVLTAFVNSRTSGDGGWILTARTNCIRGSSSCGSRRINTSGSFGAVTPWTFTSTPNTGFIRTTFVGTWFGIPGSVTGDTPRISCTSTHCTFGP